MKRRLKLKPFVVPMLYCIFVVGLIISFYITTKLYKEEDKDNLTYVSNLIEDESVPVINMEAIVLKPYQNIDVKIGKNFYAKDDDEDTQKNSLVYYESTYMPNSGIDYVLETSFDINSILDGEVIDVKEEELLGKTVTVKHDNELISVYQGLSEIMVKKNDQVAIGQIIGKSGTSEISKELGNHLHFELILKGQTVDPENYYDKKLSEIE